MVSTLNLSPTAAVAVCTHCPRLVRACSCSDPSCRGWFHIDVRIVDDCLVTVGENDLPDVDHWGEA